MDMSGTQYRCVVKNSIDEVTSDAATLTVQKATTPIEPKYVRYIVEHYKQNADGSYTLADTEQPIDEIGKTVTATPKTYEGLYIQSQCSGNGCQRNIESNIQPGRYCNLEAVLRHYPLYRDGKWQLCTDHRRWQLCKGRHCYHRRRNAQRLHL